MTHIEKKKNAPLSILDALKVIFVLRFVRSSELIPGMYVETKYDFGKIPAVSTLKRIVHELKFFRFLKIPSYKSNLL